MGLRKTNIFFLDEQRQTEAGINFTKRDSSEQRQVFTEAVHFMGENCQDNQFVLTKQNARGWMT